MARPVTLFTGQWADLPSEWGVQDAVAFVRRTDFAPSQVAFDAAMQRSD